MRNETTHPNMEPMVATADGTAAVFVVATTCESFNDEEDHASVEDWLVSYLLTVTSVALTYTLMDKVHHDVIHLPCCQMTQTVQASTSNTELVLSWIYTSLPSLWPFGTSIWNLRQRREVCRAISERHKMTSSNLWTFGNDIVKRAPEAWFLCQIILRDTCCVKNQVLTIQVILPSTNRLDSQSAGHCAYAANVQTQNTYRFSKMKTFHPSPACRWVCSFSILPLLPLPSTESSH